VACINLLASIRAELVPQASAGNAMNTQEKPFVLLPGVLFYLEYANADSHNFVQNGSFICLHCQHMDCGVNANPAHQSSYKES
jgi:hypothetical protein